MNTIPEIKNLLKGFYDGQIKSLNGMMERQPELKEELAKLRDDANQQLAKLAPLDQVPAALDMSYTLNALGSMFERMTTYADDLANRLKGMQAKVVSLNSLETRISTKDLIAKDEVTELVKTAKADERKAVEGELRPQIVAMRKRVVELASLPLPGDDILALTAEAFDQRLDGCKKNAATAKAKGLDINAKLVERCAWNSEADFATELKSIDELLGRKGGTPPAGQGHPLKGAEGAAGETKTNTPAKARFIC